jgi:hypothetical protein
MRIVNVSASSKAGDQRSGAGTLIIVTPPQKRLPLIETFILGNPLIAKMPISHLKHVAFTWSLVNYSCTASKREAHKQTLLESRLGIEHSKLIDPTLGSSSCGDVFVDLKSGGR